MPEVLAIPLPYGGEDFAGPVIVDEAVLSKLHQLLEFSPLYILRALTILEACKEAFPGVPAVLTFGSAFFVDLPPREQRYAIDRTNLPWLRRFGYQGLFHQAACSHVLRSRHERGAGKSPLRSRAFCPCAWRISRRRRRSSVIAR